MSERHSAMIIGGGIGGLITALKLHRQGIYVKVFESVENIKALGVGINLLPHAVKVLTELGLDKRLEAIGVPTAELMYVNKYGSKIWREDRGLKAGYSWPQYSIHRGELQLLLLDEVIERLGEDAVHTGHHLQTFEADETQVTAHFINKKTRESVGTYHADMMIAADGIHSVVRSSYYPEEGAPNFSDRILWRAVTEAPPYLTGKSMIMAGYQDQKFVAYPISNAIDGNSKSLINWIAELAIERDMPDQADWNKKIDKEKFAPAFSN